jgi:pyruvate,water dikinase
MPGETGSIPVKGWCAWSWGWVRVDRVASDYPRMLALSHPELRPEGSGDVGKYSQHLVDLLDLEENSFSTVGVNELLSRGDYPNLNLLASLEEDGCVIDFIGNRLPSGHGSLVLTFDRLVRRTSLVEVLRAILGCLEEGYGCPVDIEFTAFVDRDGHVRVNLLQCRPLFVAGESGVAMMPSNLRPDQVLFRSTRMINGGKIGNIRYILYIDPHSYSMARGADARKRIGRIVGQINDHPRIKAGKVVMIGPGRWGSSNIDLGINVRYGEIDNASVLVEVAREESGHVPDVSYGTHFFQDLVEEGIIYMPVWPDDSASEFNAGYFENAPNALLEFAPGAGDFLDVVKVIDTNATRTQWGVVVADPQSRKALMYLEP